MNVRLRRGLFVSAIALALPSLAVVPAAAAPLADARRTPVSLVVSRGA